METTTATLSPNYDDDDIRRLHRQFRTVPYTRFLSDDEIGNVYELISIYDPSRPRNLFELLRQDPDGTFSDYIDDVQIVRMYGHTAGNPVDNYTYTVNTLEPDGLKLCLFREQKGEEKTTKCEVLNWVINRHTGDIISLPAPNLYAAWMILRVVRQTLNDAWKDSLRENSNET